MSSTTTHLKNTSAQGEAAFGSFGSAAHLTDVGNTWTPEAQFTCRNLGSAGYWYIIFARTTGPTTSVYSVKLGPGEPYTERNPPKGEVWALADGSVNGNLSWYVGGYNP